ncbi:hypothetical protein [Leuconostoc falkenbergense]|nr:hypothetical protein [Leuconostoc falkenbergense]
MTYTKNTSSTLKAVKGSGVVYLSKRDEAAGRDIDLDLQGYTITAL